MKKNILFIATLNSIHTLKWVNFFLDLNYEVSVLSLSKKNEDFKFSKKINLYIYNKYNNRFINFLFSLPSILLKRKFFSQNDIIHVHYIGFNGLISLIFKTKNLILTAWGNDIKILNFIFLRRIIIRLLLKKSKIITTDSREMKNLIIKIDKKSEGKIKIINFGIDTKHFSKKEYNTQMEVKLDLQNYKDYLKIISLRNHDSVYDIETLILSIKKLTELKIKVICLIYGKGTETHKLKKMTENLNLQNNIFFKGYYQQDELPNIFSVMDCYVSTSLSDAGISASTAEAMSCSLPSISADNSENYLWIKHNKSGFLFENKNVDKLTDILINLKNFNLLKIGSEGRKTILNNNDYTNEMKKVEVIYNDLSY